MSAREVVVFLGPSLELAKARRLLDATYLPPARQGDVFRVLVRRPRVVVLIDGVFEAVPSVWHHELRAALACGVHLVGASSMGALRAAELHHEGMVPVGRIAGDYLECRRVDDGDVAVLHGPAETGYRALTVPLVNVEATLAHARRAGQLSPAEARRLEATARGTFYKQRTWRQLVQTLSPRNAERRAGFLRWLKVNMIDQKAADAVAALRVAKQLARRAPREVKVAPLNSFVRRRRLHDVHGEVLEQLQRAPDADALARQGVRRLLLASFARMGGLTVEPRAGRAIDGLAPDEAAADAEVVALESLVLSAPERFVSDGPTWLEGLALEARLTGRWPSSAKRGKTRRSTGKSARRVTSERERGR